MPGAQVIEKPTWQQLSADPPDNEMPTRPTLPLGVLIATVATVAAGVAWALVRPPVADMAAQVFRAKLFEQSGYQIWNGQWYGGHHLPGYSLLMPPIGGAVGAWWAGCIAAAAASVGMAVLARACTRTTRGTVGITVLLDIGVIASLLSGRTTWLLGVSFASVSIAALIRGKGAVAVATALLSPLASPVAAMFLALIAAAAAIKRERRVLGALVIVAATLPGVLFAFIFPEGGSQPFPATSFVPMTLAVAFLLAILPASKPDLRFGVGLYLLLLVATLVISSPIGSNAVRLGQISGPAVVALAFAFAGGMRLTTRRRALFATAFAAMVILQWIQPIRDVMHARIDATTNPEFHQPLIEEVKSLGGAPGRIEILWTRGHWEDAYVAPEIPMARGWERQLDRRFNNAVSQPKLSEATFNRWLDSLAVRWVAVPNAPIDGSVKGEELLLERGTSRLDAIWQNPDWKLFAVRNPQSLASGPATATQLRSREVLLDFRRPGTALVRVRWSRWWRLQGVTVCLEPSRSGMTLVHATRSGLARLVITDLTGGPSCE